MIKEIRLYPKGKIKVVNVNKEGAYDLEEIFSYWKAGGSSYYLIRCEEKRVKICTKKLVRAQLKDVMKEYNMALKEKLFYEEILANL